MPKSSKHHKTSSADKEEKSRIKDEKEKKISENKDRDVEKKQALQVHSEAPVFLDNTGLCTVES